MAGFVKTVGVMMLGGAMSAAGFVAAVAMPQIRAALAGDDAFASVLRSPGALPGEETSAAAPFEPGASVPAQPFAAAFEPPAAADFGAAPPASTAPSWDELPSFTPPGDTSSNPAADAFSSAAEFGAAATSAAADAVNEFAASVPAGSPVDGMSTSWASAVAGLTQAGVEDFQVLPAGDDQVRMVVWLREDDGGRVTRQLQGTGPTPAAAAAAALQSITEHRRRSDWLK